MKIDTILNKLLGLFGRKAAGGAAKKASATASTKGKPAGQGAGTERHHAKPGRESAKLARKAARIGRKAAR